MQYIDMMRRKVLGLTDAQDFVREATNNEQWGPTSKQHQQIIQYTYHYQECMEVMGYIYKRLGEDGKNWRTIYKALLVLDNILKNGSEEAVNIALTRTVEVKTLTSFQKIDENGKDVGINVRERSKQIMELLNDKDYLRQTREDAKKQKKDYSGVGNSSSYSGYSSNTFSGSSNYNNNAFDDDFSSFGNSSSSNTYGGYSDKQEEKKEEENQYQDQEVQKEEEQYQEQEEQQEQFSFGAPGSYKDKGYQNNNYNQRQQRPIQQKQMQQPQQQQSVNLFDFGDAQPKQQMQQKQNYSTSANLFDMLDSQPQQNQMNQQMNRQQPMQQRQVQNNSDLFWGSQPSQPQQNQMNQQMNRQQPMQQRQQQSSASLFDFGTPAQPQQQYGQPKSNAIYNNNQMNTMDLFSGVTMNPAQPAQPMQQMSQPQQQTQQNAFDFGDFSSAPAQQPKQNDWRANIRVDSLADNRKQQQQRPQQKQTLGSFL